MLVVEAVRPIEHFGFVHSIKKDSKVTIPRGAIGLVDRNTLPKEGDVTVEFDHGVSNIVTMVVPVVMIVKEGKKKALPLPG